MTRALLLGMRPDGRLFLEPFPTPIRRKRKISKRKLKRGKRK